ncbi:LOW QUALITY PROTEIN: cytosolic protein [Bacillus sp. JCM 19046]|nr:LOW QUALITY PROTEIN: cytosolic protein [Bacillus sp. JCM 19045]GAF16496.1 LOW QUALITY PROTEIN: cytosolic protein [Bacillus sp. JCM 19046]
MNNPNRQGIVVWLTSLKYARQLRRFGHVQYVSKKSTLFFIVIRTKWEDLIKKLSSFHFVTDVQPSMRPFISTDYQNAKPDKAKEYDYKLGI